MVFPTLFRPLKSKRHFPVMSARANVLSKYRQLLKGASKLPDSSKRQEALTEVRKQFRANSEIGSEEVAALLDKANSSLGYLKIITPRGRQESQTGVTKLVFGPETGPSGRKATTNWTGSNLDPDSVRRHQNILKRAGFKDNKTAKGIF